MTTVTSRTEEKTNDGATDSTQQRNMKMGTTAVTEWKYDKKESRSVSLPLPLSFLNESLSSSSSYDAKFSDAELLVSRTVLLTGDDIYTKREELRLYFHKTFSLYESLFDVLLNDSTYYLQPDKLRHPLIFYYGHTAVFFINKLLMARLISSRVNSHIESICANVEWINKSPQLFVNGADGGSARVTLTGGFFLLVGGENYQGTRGMNDVWATSNGITWIWVAGVANGEEHPSYPETFTPAESVGHCQDRTYRQYRAGGTFNRALQNEVWTSTDYGQHWSQPTAAAPWEPRWLPAMTTDSYNYVYLAGGLIEDRLAQNNDVWKSTNSGRTWQLVTSPRYLESGKAPLGRGAAILLNSPSVWPGQEVILWLTGYNQQLNQYQRDVWVTRTSGSTWDRITSDAAYGPRDDCGAEITPQGLIVLAGGYSGTEIMNDVWASADGGYSWGICVAEAEWEDRRYQMTAFDGQGLLWVFGGEKFGILYDDMWQSTWSFNQAQQTASRCHLTVPSCGIGLQCYPTDNGTAVSVDRTAVYCKACPFTDGVATSSATSNTLMLVFMIVFLLIAVVAVSALLYTCYKLRSAGSPSPIPLPAAAQKWWNQSNTESLGGGGVEASLLNATNHSNTGSTTAGPTTGVAGVPYQQL